MTTPHEQVPDRGAETPRTSEKSSSAPQESQYPQWVKYAEVLGKPVSAIVAALAVAYIGFLGQRILDRQQTLRAYTELLNQREEAESSIRRDMFVTILDKFFADSSQDSTNVSEQLERLEVLALNFSETLSLRPLFRALNRAINREGQYDGLMSKVRRAEDRRRLRSLANRVTGWQLSRLEVAGHHFEFGVPLSEVANGDAYSYEDELSLGGIERAYRITVENFEPLLRTVDVRLRVETPPIPAVGGVAMGDADSAADPDTTAYSGSAADSYTVAVADRAPNRHCAQDDEDAVVQRRFSLSYYDFPLIDNTRLTCSQRFALVIKSVTPTDLKLEAVVFPAEYAAQREAQSLPAIVEQLNGKQR